MCVIVCVIGMVEYLEMLICHFSGLQYCSRLAIGTIVFVKDKNVSLLFLENGGLCLLG